MHQLGNFSGPSLLPFPDSDLWWSVRRSDSKVPAGCPDNTQLLPHSNIMVNPDLQEKHSKTILSGAGWPNLEEVIGIMPAGFSSGSCLSDHKFIPRVGPLVQKLFASVPSTASQALNGREDQNLAQLWQSVLFYLWKIWVLLERSLVCWKACQPLDAMWTTSYLISVFRSVAKMSPQWTSHPVTYAAPVIPDLAYSCRFRGPGTFFHRFQS